MADISFDDFEQQARDFLDANATKKEAEKKFVWGQGSDKVSMFEEKDRDTELADVRKAQEWRAKKFDAGFGWITGPAKYGGRELPRSQLPSLHELPRLVRRWHERRASDDDLPVQPWYA